MERGKKSNMGVSIHHNRFFNLKNDYEQGGWIRNTLYIFTRDKCHYRRIHIESMSVKLRLD